MNKTLTGVLAVIVIIGAGYAIYDYSSSNPSVIQYMGGTNSGENAPEGSIHNLPIEPAAAKARADLATKLGVAESSIVIMLVEEATWSDGCLGLGGPAESCLAALVEGFKVEMEVQGKTYVYRTDGTGAAVRAETQI